MITWLDHPDQPLPAASRALGSDTDAPGLLAAGGVLSMRRLEEAYSHGVFPWYAPGQPVLWWSPDPRMVLYVDEFRLSRSLRKTVQRFAADAGCAVRIDSAFGRVIRACSQAPRPGQDGTWIVPEMIAAYEAWHAAGRVHSVETWIDGDLVGGLYGVSLGRMFFGESMFSRRTDASKIALAALVCFCRAHGIGLIDCQQNTSHLASFGGREIPRAAFERELAARLGQPPVADWTYDLRHWAWLRAGPPAPAAAASPVAPAAAPADPPGHEESGT